MPWHVPTVKPKLNIKINFLINLSNFGINVMGDQYLKKLNGSTGAFYRQKAGITIYIKIKIGTHGKHVPNSSAQLIVSIYCGC